MSELYFSSNDHAFGLYVGSAHVQHILRLCTRSGVYETGGVLAGHYTDAHDCAIVTAVSGPPADSQRGRATFYRGTRDLQPWLDRLWRAKRHYYLGEWHYHPNASARPSLIDIQQMQEIGNASQYNCPEPILLIIGGDPSGWEAEASVCPRANSAIAMRRCKPSQMMCPQQATLLWPKNGWRHALTTRISGV